MKRYASGFRRLLKPLVLACMLSLLPVLLWAQDTLSFMHYNLLYYGYYTSFCNEVNNPVERKDEFLQTLIEYIRPDVFTVNELGRDVQTAERIRDRVLNAVMGDDLYEHAPYSNRSNASLVSMLFYRSDKFAIQSHTVLSTSPRDIILYTMYYRDPGLEEGRDTTFLHCVVAHFKAGSTVGDQQIRTAEAMAVMGAIEQLGIRGNLAFMADFNMKSSYEQAYQWITYHPNEAIRFHDPIDRPGIWFNNPDMAAYHTQSTRTGRHPCFVTGGMDDRFDQILLSASILSGDGGLQYIEGTYRALGQDGMRFNGSLIDPPNESEPEELIMALYQMSDHLPVVLQMITTEVVSGIHETDRGHNGMSLRVDALYPDLIELHVAGYEGPLEIGVYSMMGREWIRMQGVFPTHGQLISLPLKGLIPGAYVLRVFCRRAGHASVSFLVI